MITRGAHASVLTSERGNTMTTLTSRVMKRSAGIAGALALAATLTLTGCANPLDALVEKATSGALDKIVEQATDGALQGVATGKLPDDFPSGVPVPDLTPTQSGKHVQDGTTAWIVHYAEGVDDSTYTDLVSSLVSAGFDEDSSTNMGDALTMGMYTNGTYTVTASQLGEGGERVVQLMVFEE